ncbi:DUF1499 domain-containing protein [Roseibacterium sp. SDUM158016]|jgi:hypothetical protein|uniref:DUF1499 domain-containing protein n=1 Tax=Roseicyclus sediminis TaxID=2980997 RepID=UPI0021D2D50F|nr:DUF1499 domain-containing protein [Roseibacterium sp. SDUM158016]MCU4655150.1 DUF1499 domain-containing protein [Roseibacterium sp. SDUM158016]
MRILFVLLVLVAMAGLGAAVFFRLAPMPAEVWHVDPATAQPPESPNYELRQGAEAPVLEGDPASVATALDAAARAEGARPIAGDLADGFATYVVRTRIMGFPDAVSIRLSPEGEGTRVEIFSRSRFGYSDMGVNAARVARWIDAASR